MAMSTEFTLEQAIPEADSLANMLQSPGWKWIEVWFKGLEAASVDRLIHAQLDIDKTREQQMILAIRVLLQEPRNFISATRAAEAKAKSLEVQEPQA